MVGDSLADVQMAKAGGAGLAVAIGAEALEDADYQITKIDDLLLENERLLWA